MTKWLAIYVDEHGNQRAATISVATAGTFPFGVNEFELGLDAYDGEPVILAELPVDTDFQTTVVDVTDDVEVPMQFIDLP